MKSVIGRSVRWKLWHLWVLCLLSIPSPAHADNCGSLSDCYAQILVAILVALAIALLILLLLELAAAAAAAEAAGSGAGLVFLEGGAASGVRTFLVDTASGRVFVGGPSLIHIQVFEAAGLQSHIGVVGGFARFETGRLISFELTSGTFPGTAVERELARRILEALRSAL